MLGLSSNSPDSFSQLKISHVDFRASDTSRLQALTCPTPAPTGGRWGWSRMHCEGDLIFPKNTIHWPSPEILLLSNDNSRKKSTLTKEKWCWLSVRQMLGDCRPLCNQTHPKGGRWGLSRMHYEGDLILIIKKSIACTIHVQLYLELVCKVHTCLAVVNNGHLTKKNRNLTLNWLQTPAFYGGISRDFPKELPILTIQEQSAFWYKST